MAEPEYATRPPVPRVATPPQKQGKRYKSLANGTQSTLNERQENNDTFSKAGQAAPQLLFQHAVQRLQVAAVVGVEEVAALCSEHAPQAAAFHPTERLACCQDALSPLQYLHIKKKKKIASFGHAVHHGWGTTQCQQTAQCSTEITDDPSRFDSYCISLVGRQE